MIGEIQFFRKRIFGGFNRRDVVDYIKRLAEERNNYREERDSAAEKAHQLNEELMKLRRELGSVEQRERQVKKAALEEAAKTLVELETAFISMLADIKSTSASTRTELDKAYDILERFPAVLEKSGERIGKLRDFIDDEIAEVF